MLFGARFSLLQYWHGTKLFRPAGEIAGRGADGIAASAGVSGGVVADAAVSGRWGGARYSVGAGGE